MTLIVAVCASYQLNNASGFPSYIILMRCLSYNCAVSYQPDCIEWAGLVWYGSIVGVFTLRILLCHYKTNRANM